MPIGFEAANGKERIAGFDVTRIVLRPREIGLPGFIEVEKADLIKRRG